MKFKLITLICINALSIFAQSDTLSAPSTTRIFIGASTQYGFIWTHRHNMGHLVKKHIAAFELDISKSDGPERAFHQPFHFPWTGIALHFIPLGNPEELGTAIGIYPFINFPLGKKNRKIKTHLRFGYGIGYITKSFDPIENHKNVAIGSHINACMSLRLNEQWKLNANNYVEFGIGITHFSNGASKLPNLGLNLPLLNFGFHHLFYQNICTKTSNDYRNQLANTKAMLEQRNWKLNLLLVTGFNDLEPPGGKRFGVLNIESSLMRQTARKHKWGLGLDLMYSDAIRIKLATDTIHVSAFENLQPGGKIVYEFVVGRLSFPIEFGIYIYSRYKNLTPVYNRFAVQYLVGKHLLLNISLKTHLARAEYFEFGGGWKF